MENSTGDSGGDTTIEGGVACSGSAPGRGEGGAARAIAAFAKAVFQRAAAFTSRKESAPETDEAMNTKRKKKKSKKKDSASNSSANRPTKSRSNRLFGQSFSSARLVVVCVYFFSFVDFVAHCSFLAALFFSLFCLRFRVLW